MVDILCHLPYLKNVIFSYTSKNPIITWVPWKIWYFTRVTTMNEKQFRWAIFSILRCLLDINPAKEASHQIKLMYSKQSSHSLGLSKMPKQSSNLAISKLKKYQATDHWVSSWTNLLRSQTMSLLPRQQEAKIVSFLGFHPTWKTSSLRYITEKWSTEDIK